MNSHAGHLFCQECFTLDADMNALWSPGGEEPPICKYDGGAAVRMRGAQKALASHSVAPCAANSWAPASLRDAQPTSSSPTGIAGAVNSWAAARLRHAQPTSAAHTGNAGAVSGWAAASVRGAQQPSSAQPGRRQSFGWEVRAAAFAAQSQAARARGQLVSILPARARGQLRPCARTLVLTRGRRREAKTRQGRLKGDIDSNTVCYSTHKDGQGWTVSAKSLLK